MRTKVRVLANIYVEGHVDESLFQFNRTVPIYYYHAIRAFVKNCPLIKNATEENFQTIILITIVCSNDENAMTILHGLNGCIKTHVNFIQELPNKEDSTPKNNSISSEIDYIAKNLDDSDLFLQMAEEAEELSHACLKYVRAHKGNNPTKDSEDVYLKNILEELTDVRVSAELLNIEEDIDIYLNKIHRWADRIRKKNGGSAK